MLGLCPAVTADDKPVIDAWYGDTQQFGSRGNTQPMINILGSIRPSALAANPYFRVNGGTLRPFVLGTDLHRLANDGDFNLEIDRASLKPGKNVVQIHVRTPKGVDVTRDVEFQYEQGRKWELPYKVDFTKVSSIQDVVEVIDGKWRLTNDGLRTAEPYYDRQIAFGDSSWKDYELEAEILIHRMLPDLQGRNQGAPPYLSHSHVSFNLRWAGHPDDGFSPRRDWQNLGSLVALRADLSTPNRGSYWWMHFGRGVKGRPAKRSLTVREKRLSVQPDTRYRYRMKVETLGEARARYSTKMWATEDAEPDDWQMVAVDESERFASGSAVFVVHHSDVTLCSIVVRLSEP